MSYVLSNIPNFVSSLNNFAYMWVSKQEYDEIGNALEAVDSKCF